MFRRRTDGVLVFENLDFEVMVHNQLDFVAPQNMKELEWMVERMIESIQLCAWEHASDSEYIDEDWEDIFAQC